MNAAEYLLAASAPDRAALLAPDRQYTHRELRDAVERVSSALIAERVHAQDRVLLIAENSFFWVVAYLATIRAGYVCVPLPHSISGPELQDIVSAAKPALAFVKASCAAGFHAAFPMLPVFTENDLPRLPRPCGRQAAIDGENNLAALMFTSGSTGTPRGVMVTHSNIIANTESIIEYLRLTSTDRVMAVLPFNYCFGTSLLHTHLRVGGSLVLEPNFLFPNRILERMQETSCTGFAGVPSHYQILLRQSALKRTPLPSLRCCQQAGGALAPVFIRELVEALPGVDVYVMYGQTEATARLAYLPPQLLTRKIGSIGKAIPGVKLEIRDEAGNLCAPGEVGEIVARGANITAGYWNDPVDTAATFRGGWLNTGDLARTDDEGFIYLIDRAKDFLKCGGNRVSCRDIEQRLLEFPAVREAAVIGEPDEILGEAVKAFVVPASGQGAALQDELSSFCKRRFPPHLRPKHIAIVASLPKNSAGKILKAGLRAATAARSAAVENSAL